FSYMNNVMQGEYDRQQWLETRMMNGWDTFWYYDLLPGLQSMTRQLNVGLAQQAFQMQADTDATETMEVSRALSKHEEQDRNVAGGGEMCVAATVSGGFTKTESFARDMRLVWERDSLAAGLNEKADGKGTPYPGASSQIGSYAQQYNDYLNIFCDPNANSGKNDCLKSTSVNPPLYNADVEPVRYIYSNLTIPVDKADNPQEGADVATAVNDIINNMVGIPAAAPMTSKVLASVPGEEVFMRRRAYLARYAAIRSVPDLIASWRMPGSGNQLGQEVKDLRQEAGVSLGNVSATAGGYISKDPSYKEIMHAVSVDQFNTGKFALGMITNRNRLQMEKLNLSAFYLMQLRDYYALLERTAMVLAVQVSIRDEEQMNTMQNIYKAAPVK
ncbi:MAG: hypothetical protein KGQ70_08865, partial [Alphaproteobacteria bacterium]|nr:hypothetical protein [Alphaproteobacteria bacterium]